MTLPTTKPSTDVKPPFKWRTGGGVFIAPADMETRHLYFTVRMIWNHTVPEQFKLRPFNEYIFPPIYTTEFMAEALKHMLCELAVRKDLPEHWAQNLNYMVKTASQILGGLISEG